MKVIETYIVWCNRLGTIPATMHRTEGDRWFWLHFDCGQLHNEELSADVAAELIEAAKEGKGRKPVKPR